MTKLIDNRYLEPSPFEADCGVLVGKSPEKIPRADLLDLGGPTSPIDAIRAKCIDCSGGVMAEVRKCVTVKCPLWPMRMGRNPFHGSAKS